jgi:hypothetical protein
MFVLSFGSAPFAFDLDILLGFFEQSGYTFLTETLYQQVVFAGSVLIRFHFIVFGFETVFKIVYSALLSVNLVICSFEF